MTTVETKERRTPEIAQPTSRRTGRRSRSTESVPDRL